jgi:hypothetical protein
MSTSSIRRVDSKDHMLNPTDIFAVAAHDSKDYGQGFKTSAKKHGVSSERILYTILVKQYSDPRLLRIREGNALFTIAAMPQRVGMVQIYNGDVEQNYASNILEFLNASRKMGFDALLFMADLETAKALKIVQKKYKEPDSKFHFDSTASMVSVRLGKIRGE